MPARRSRADLGPISPVLAEDLERAGREHVGGQRLGRRDLLRVRADAREVVRRELLVDRLQRDVGVGVGGHVRDRADGGEQPASLSFNEGVHRGRHQPEAELAAARAERRLVLGW